MSKTSCLAEPLDKGLLQEAEFLCHSAKLIPEGIESLAKRLALRLSQGKKLRVKLGIDPTGADLHLGHASVLRLMRRFQDCGHQAVLVTGGFTAQIGDPTGRNSTRPALDQETVNKNAEHFLDQASLILDLSKVEFHNNVDWFASMTLHEFLKISSFVSCNQLLAKDAFGTRLDNGQSVALSELFYPLLQGFDSVKLASDIELGGTDQLFNIMQGRHLQQAFGLEPQMGLLVPILVGSDGRKMSKTFGNALSLRDSADCIVAFCMRLPDELLLTFFEQATNLSLPEITKIRERQISGENPMHLKMELGKLIASELQGTDQAAKAANEWMQVHSKREIPESMDEHQVLDSIGLITLLRQLNFAPSNSSARKLIEGGAVRIDGQKIIDPKAEVRLTCGEKKTLQVGRRQFMRLIKPN